MQTTTRITVHGYHVDHFGHVNHSRVVELLEEARWRYLEKNGLMNAIHTLGAIHVVARLEIDYRHPARAMEVLRFETRVGGRSEHGFRMDQDVFLDDSDRAVVHARVFNVFVDRGGRSKRIDGRVLECWPDLAAAPSPDA